MIFGKISEKNRVIIGVVLFIAIFATLLALASVFDLDVSKILTQDALKDGEYLASDTFGVAFEIFGSSPVYLIAGVCVVILFWCVLRFLKLRPLREILAVILLASAVLAFWFFFHDMFNYISEHAGTEDTYLDGAMTLVAVLSSFLATTAVVFAFRGVKDETLKKLVKFVIAFIIMAAVANLIIAIVKVPAGRMRFRAMNSSGDVNFEGFTAWYVMNGKRTPTAEEMAMYGWASDAFKSFPSGHTCAAGMSYALIMLPNVLKTKKKWLRALCWIFPVAFTGVVAVSRIVVGAHYFSDVLFGGTIAFLGMMLAREICVCKFSHFKCFGKNYVPAVEEDDETEE